MFELMQAKVRDYIEMKSGYTAKAHVRCISYVELGTHVGAIFEDKDTGNLYQLHYSPATDRIFFNAYKRTCETMV